MSDALVLNWNELHVTRDSVRLLLKEPTVEKVILVDNGSTDGSQEYFSSLDNPKFEFISLPENMGASVARNKAIDATSSRYVFMLDGDILYVKGTIEEYEKILDHYSDAACVGQNSMELLARLGHNGVYDIAEADFRMESDYTIEDWFPMAWTQYGLFRGDLLRDVKFVEDYPFNQAGYGFEDDDLFHRFKKLGYVSLSVDKPVYYHHAHSGMRELTKAGVADMFAERKKVFDATWGKGNGWGETLKRTNPEKTTRPNPS